MISHHHKTIFVHIPKCGGQSIEMMFIKDVGLTWKTRAPLLLRANKIAALGPARLAHLTMADYIKCKYIPQELSDTYYKFTVVRDPIARVLSMYNYLDLSFGFDSFLETWLPERLDKQVDPNSDGAPSLSYFVRPQADYIFDDDGKLLVDEVFMLESMNLAEAKVRSLLHTTAELGHVNSSKEKKVGFRDLSPSQKETIIALYKRDYDLLDYQSDHSNKPTK